MALTDEQLDLLLKDEELGKYSKEYHDYKMTYRDFKAKKHEIYKRLGIEINTKPINHKERLECLKEIYDEGDMDKAYYEKKLKRIKQDIKDESNSLEKKKQLGIQINGSIFADDNNIDIDEADFFKEFIDFIEARGWNFGGGISQVDEDGKYIK